jgi:predicted nicotinamide N-methyase
MPYWAELWPAAAALAEFLLARAPLAGEDVLELGAGLGIPGIAAALAGARSVVFTDYFEEALALAAENARLNGLARVETRLLDWRRPALTRRFRVVIGSDLLYERRNHAPLAATLAAALAEDGVAWIADPERAAARGFADALAAEGLALETAAALAVPRGRVAVMRITSGAREGS